MEQMTLDLIRQVDRLQAKVDGLVKPETPNTQDWTPTITQSVGVTFNASWAKYISAFGIVIVTAKLDVTGAGTATNDIIIGGLPLNIPGTSTFECYGNALVTDVTAGAFSATVTGSAAAAIKFRDVATGGFVGTIPNFALASGDFISFIAVYHRT